jgi:hypothetical protein
MREPRQSSSFGPPGIYRGRWQSWGNDPLVERAGITFDRTPSGPIIAPAGKFRVCAYHIDWDERPTCWLDVDTRAEAIYVCENLCEAAGDRNVDVAVAYDDTGRRVTE